MFSHTSRFFTLINQNSPDAYDEIEEALTNGNLPPDAADVNGVTLLLCAVRRLNFRLVELLLNEGANPFIVSKYGQCAAGLISRFGDVRFQRVIHDLGDSTESYDASAEAWPVVQGLCRDSVLGDTSRIKRKLGSGVAVEDRDAWGHTALMLAVLHGQADAAQMLFQAGAGPNNPQTLVGFPMRRFMNALKPLQAIPLTQCMEVICKKLACSLRSDPSSAEPISPEHLASIASIHHLVRRGDTSRIKRLLDLGVSPKLKNSRGLTVLDVANLTHEEEAKRLVTTWIEEDRERRLAEMKKAASSEASMSIGSAGNAEADAVSQSLKTNGSQGRGRRPQRSAPSSLRLNAKELIEAGDIVGLQVLLSTGASPDSLLSNKTSMLVHAARRCEESFLFLLLNGASPDLADPSGTTAEMAVRHSPQLSYLVKNFVFPGNKATLNSSDKLLDAVLKGDCRLTACLGEANRQFLHAKTRGGLTLLGIAVGMEDVLLCEILLDLGADPWEKCFGKILPVDLARRMKEKKAKKERKEPKELTELIELLHGRMESMKAWVRQSREPLKTFWYESAAKAVEEEEQAESTQAESLASEGRRQGETEPQPVPEPPAKPEPPAEPEPLAKPEPPAEPESPAEPELPAELEPPVKPEPERPAEGIPSGSASSGSDEPDFIEEAFNSSDPVPGEEGKSLPSEHPVAGKLEEDDYGIFSDAEADDREAESTRSVRADDSEAFVPPSAASLSESLRGLGYSLGAAVADIVDNAIAAGAKRIWIDYSSGKASSTWFSVRDDGCGMSEAELQVAMKIGSKSPKALRAKTDLGRFGLGLKTASFSQCRRLVVCSVKNGNAAAYAWDLDTLAEKDEWLLEKIPGPLEDARFESLKKQASGTVVLWEKIDRAFGSVEASDDEFDKARLEALDRLKKHLRLTFHQYLTADLSTGESDIDILFGAGSAKLEPWDPFMSSSFASPCRFQEEFWPADAAEPQVSFRPYVVPAPKSSPDEITLYGPEDLLDMQGFFIYRGKRLICCAGWLNLGVQKTPLHALARIKLTFDSKHDLDWELDIRKSTVKIPRRKGWNRLKQLLCRRAAAAVKKSEEVLVRSGEWTAETEAEADSSAKSMWRKERGQAPQIDFSSRLAAAFRDALARVREPDIVQGLMELMAFSHPAAAARAASAEASPLARAAIVELAYELADGKAENVRDALVLLASHEPFCSWPAIMDEFKEAEE